MRVTDETAPAVFAATATPTRIVRERDQHRVEPVSSSSSQHVTRREPVKAAPQERNTSTRTTADQYVTVQEEKPHAEPQRPLHATSAPVRPAWQDWSDMAAARAPSAPVEPFSHVDIPSRQRRLAYRQDELKEIIHRLDTAKSSTAAVHAGARKHRYTTLEDTQKVRLFT